MLLAVGACATNFAAHLECHDGSAGAEPRERLQEVLDRRQLFRELEGSERARVRMQVAQALEELSKSVGISPELRSEAAFRAAEIWRADGYDSAAIAGFRSARDLGAGTPFRPRATLELGHLARRRMNWSSALDAYFELSHDEGARRVDRDAALYWSGVVWLNLDELDAARRAWRWVSQFAERPLARVRSYDQLSLLEFNCGNLTGARDVLAVCDTRLRALASEFTVLGASVRGALARMRSRRCVANANQDDTSASEGTDDAD